MNCWILKFKESNNDIKKHIKTVERSPVNLLCHYIFFVMVERYHVSRFIGTPRLLFFRWLRDGEEFLERHE